MLIPRKFVRGAKPELILVLSFVPITEVEIILDNLSNTDPSPNIDTD
jgi:hypothetical protein